MTPLSCSSDYIKSGGFGEYCVPDTSTATQLMQISFLLNDYRC